MNDPRAVQEVLKLALQDNPNKSPQDIHVLYLGTATYDINGFRARQTQRFVEAGCTVNALKVAGVLEDDEDNHISQLSDEERLRYYESQIDDADILVVGGGNTLFALDRWRALGLDNALRRAADRGAVLTGGSAGAIWCFDGGHSNSADPATYKSYRVKKFAHRSPEEIVDEIYSYKMDTGDDDNDESDTEDSSDSEDSVSDHDMSYSDSESDSDSDSSKSKQSTGSSWEYFRVSGLGILPGLVSPHLDRTQSNGVLRAHDFDKCLLQHPGEVGIGIDHFAALIIDGSKFRILSLEGKEGTVKNGNEFVEDGSGCPGVWVKHVVGGKVVSTACPPAGHLKDILRVASSIREDFAETEKCRKENPDCGWVPPRSLLLSSSASSNSTRQ
jgi:dipeptidase E